MENITLKISEANARKIYKTAPEEVKTILEGSCREGFFSEKITDRVKSYEDACAENGEEPIDEHAYKAFFREQLIRQDSRKIKSKQKFIQKYAL